MTEYEWHQKKCQLELALRIARRWVYPGQPEKTKEASYELLRKAEDALRLHQDARPP